MLNQLLDTYYKNFSFAHSLTIQIAAFVGYKVLIKKILAKPDDSQYFPVENLASYRTNFIDLDSVSNAKLREAAQFLVELKAKNSNNLANKIYGICISKDGSNCGSINIDRKNIDTDRHGIQISKDLLSALSTSELKAVFGHEVGHIALNHCTDANIALRLSCELASMICLSLTISIINYIIINQTLKYSNNTELAYYAIAALGLVLFNAYIKPIGREQEFAADKKATIYTRDKNIISSLKKHHDLQDELNLKRLDKYLPVEQKNPGIDSRFFLYAPKPSSFTESLTPVVVNGYKKVYPYLQMFQEFFDEHPAIEERAARIEKLTIM